MEVFDCECGVHVLSYVHYADDEPRLCVTCKFLATIKDADERAKVKAFLDRHNKEQGNVL